MLQMEEPTYIAPYGGPGKHDRCLSSHRASQPDGDRRGNDRGPGVVGLQSTLTSADRIEYPGDAMRDIVSDDVLHKETAEEDPHHGRDEVGEIKVGVGIQSDNEVLYRADKPLQQRRDECTCDTGKQRQCCHRHAPGEMLMEPVEKWLAWL